MGCAEGGERGLDLKLLVGRNRTSVEIEGCRIDSRDV
jgi:hypothetical protein